VPGTSNSFRQCERSESIQTFAAATVWIASELTLLAMTVERKR